MLTRVTNWSYQAFFAAKPGHGPSLRGDAHRSAEAYFGGKERSEGSDPTAARGRGRRTSAGATGKTAPVDVWRIRETAFEPALLARNEAIFALGNGNIGFRGNFEDGGYSVATGTYINGFYEEEPIVYPEPAFGYARTRQVMLNVADTKPIRLFIGNERFDLRTGRIEHYERSLDLRHGVLSRTIRWQSPGGITVDICVRRIVSLARPMRRCASNP